MAKRIRITLSDPITVGSIDYTHVELTNPKLGEIRQAEMEVGFHNFLAKLVSLNAKMLLSVVDQFSQEDIQACADFFESCKPAKAGLGADSPTAGGESSPA